MDFQEKINAGIAYMAAGQYEAAEDAFRDAAQMNTESAEAYEHLGNALVNRNKMEEGIQAFKTALMLSPGDGRLYYSLGSVYFLKEDMKNALLYLNKAESSGYKTADLYLLRSTILIQQEDLIQAVRETAKAIELEPLNAALYRRKVMLQVQEDQTDAALDTLEEFRELLPDALDGYEMAVTLHCIRREYGRAMELAEEGIRRFPQDPSMHFLKLQVYRESGQYEAAETLAGQILAMELTEQLKKQVTIYLAESCGQQKKADKMQKVLEDYTAQKKDAEILYMLLMVYSGLQNGQKMKECAGQILELDAADGIRAAAEFSQARATEYLDGIEAAEPMYRRLTSSLRRLSLEVPGLLEVYIYRLLSHTGLKEYDKALELADYLQTAYPQLADGHAYKAYIYTEAGRVQEAQAEREKALQINPDYYI